jgi:regulator of protease activity HflC (stomatin/prohibitin superfamily)
MIAPEAGGTVEIIGMFLLFVFFLLFGAFWLFLLSAAVLSIFAVKVRPGEIVATSRRGSRQVEHIYDRPGRYWRAPKGNVLVLRLRVDEPVTVTLKPVEVHALEATSVVVTVRLIMRVTDPVRYATAVVSKVLEEWQDEVLPGLVATVVAGHTFAQVLNDRGEVTRGIATAVLASFAGGHAPDFGLVFLRAAIIEASGPPLPRR